MQSTPITYHPEFKSSTEEGDVVLVSTDGDHFRIPTLIIRAASGFFRTTLTLPQQPQADNNGAVPSEPSIIPLPESTFVIQNICRILCFRAIDPLVALPHYKAATDLLYAAEKYELHCVSSFVRATITAPRFLDDPLRLYALSCRYNWPTECQAAALRTLDLDFSDESRDESLRSLDGSGDLLSLMRLRWARKSRFRQALDSDIFSASKTPPKCNRCSGLFTSTGWRELKWILLDELGRIPSGKTIKAPGFFDKPTVAAAFQTRCVHCNKMSVDKEHTVPQIIKVIDDLPTTP